MKVLSGMNYMYMYTNMYLPYVGVCPSLNEVLDGSRGARVGSIHEWSPALAILNIDIRTQLNQIEQSLE